MGWTFSAISGAGAGHGPYGAKGRIRNLGRVALLALAASCTAVAARAEPVEILALGDSLTAGYGLPDGEGFVPQLQAWLRANGAPEVTVINGGVSGDTTAGGLARVDWLLGDGGVDGAIVALGGNDLLRGLDPAGSRANLDAILTRLDAAGIPALLVGLPAPGNYGPEYQQAFAAMYPEVAAAHGALYAPNFLAGITDGRDPAAARALMQPDGIHPSAEGVAAVVAALGPQVLDLVRAAVED